MFCDQIWVPRGQVAHLSVRSEGAGVTQSKRFALSHGKNSAVRLKFTSDVFTVLAVLVSVVTGLHRVSDLLLPALSV